MRNRAAPLNHQIYTKLLRSFGLNGTDLAALKKRGLSDDQIKVAGYASKHEHDSSVLRIVNQCVQELNVKSGIAGFFFDDKKQHWDCAHIKGLGIPVCDIEGQIHSILFKNDNAKEKNGKIINKYLAFSSAGKYLGEKVWQTTHLPRLKGKAKDICGNEIRITEGVLKSDVATGLDDIYTIGIQGLKVHEDLPTIFEELEISTVIISLDQGEDDNADMIRCKAELINLVRKCGHDVAVEAWDAKLGKGIDDVLYNGHKDKIRRWTDAEIDEFLDKANKKNPLNGEWLYSINDRAFVNKKRKRMFDKGQFADCFGLVKTENVNLMLANGYPQVIGTIFLPAQDPIVTIDGEDYYNLWHNPEMRPIEGDIKPFVDHLEYLFPINKEREMFLDYCAYQVQNPGKKINYALLIQGPEGVGKSVMGEVMGLILGEPNVCHPTNEQLHERFSSYQKNTQLIIIEEMMSRGKLELMNKMKPMITQRKTEIREMYSEGREITNTYNIMAFTNYSDPIIIDGQDRRWFVLKTNDEIKPEEYYDDLWDWIRKKESLQALTYFFMKRDLSSFNPHGRAPKTQAKQDLIGFCRTPLEEWVIGGIESCTFPFNFGIASIREIKNGKACPHDFRTKSDLKWAEAFKKADAIPYQDRKQVWLSNGSRSVLWLFGPQKDMLSQLSPEQIAVRYEEALVKPYSNTLDDKEAL
jgi:hypothetical protein